LQRHPDFTLNPEPQPIRHLRTFSNYLTQKTGLTSVDTWTLIATYLRNMFLNWLVLISWLAAAMMILRLHLAAILLPPEGWNLSPDYLQIVRRYDVGLTILLVIGFLLIAVAMAYSILDVPSTGNARFSQNRFLKYRQLPLLMASLVLTEWWGMINHSAFGTINYSALGGPGTDGSFIYIKPVVSGDEPPDVANYAAAHSEFPHESATDQWFGESQLESYRLLGLHAVEVICGKDWIPSTLPLFFETVKKDLAGTKA